MRRAVASAVLALAVAAGCSGGGGSTSRSPAAEPAGSTSTDVPTTVRPTTSVTSTSTSTTTTPCPLTDAPTSPRTGPEPSSTMLLSDVEAAGEGCLDVVTFSFLPQPDEAPGFTVEYRPGPFAKSGSGETVTVEGQSFLVVKFFPAATADLGREGAPMTYAGPDTVNPTATHHVRQLRLVDNFEGYVTWVIGLDAQVGFEVAPSVGPPELVVTIG